MTTALFRLVGQDSITLKRRGLPTIVKGKPVPATSVDVPIKANIQSVGYADLVQLPEADRTKDLMMIMTTSEVRGMKEGSWEADEFEWDGDWWTVVRVRKWTMRVRDHYQAICARKQVK